MKGRGGIIIIIYILLLLLCANLQHVPGVVLHHRCVGVKTLKIGSGNSLH